MWYMQTTLWHLWACFKNNTFKNNTVLFLCTHPTCDFFAYYYQQYGFFFFCRILNKEGGNEESSYKGNKTFSNAKWAVAVGLCAHLYSLSPLMQLRVFPLRRNQLSPVVPVGEWFVSGVVWKICCPYLDTLCQSSLMTAETSDGIGFFFPFLCIVSSQEQGTSRNPRTWQTIIFYV